VKQWSKDVGKKLLHYEKFNGQKNKKKVRMGKEIAKQSE
jgi:hypothetical protein